MLRDPPEIASRPTNGSRPTGWEALDYTKMLTINVYSAMLPALCRLHNYQLTKANVDNEAAHNEIRNEQCWLR